VKGKMQILRNEKLTSLNGLPAQLTISGNLDIYYNPMLSSYCALKTTIFSGIAYIGINNFNPTWAQIVAGNCSK